MTLDPKEHCVFTRDGELRDGGGTPESVVAAWSKVPKAEPLVLWFHGGLVEVAAARATAKEIGEAIGEGRYPLFYIWDTGLSNELPDTIVAMATRNMVVRTIDLVMKLIGVRRTPTGRGFAATAGQEDELTPLEREILMEAVEKDPVFQTEAAAIAKAPGFAMASRTVGDRKEADLKIDAKLREMYAEDPETTELGFISTGAALLFLGKQVVEIAARVLKRTGNGRHHGLRECVFEEVVRQLRIVPEIWVEIKADAQKNFRPDAPGARLVDALAAVPDVAEREIVLVGHSTGSIMIEHFLGLASKKGLHCHVRFLAAASRCDVMSAVFDANGPAVKSIRSFGMTDATERAEHLLDVDALRRFPALAEFYRGSLLYLVSGGLEDPAGDTPLVGMLRYIAPLTAGDEEFLDPAERTCANVVRKFVEDLDPDGFVWTPTKRDAKAGYRGTSVSHGGFNDALELKDGGAIRSLLVLA